MLIVEGPDMVGKTTLCAELVRVLAEVHDLRCEADKFGREDGALTPRQLRERIRPACVCDRGPLGELTYGEVLRGKSRLSAGQYVMVDGMVEGAGGLVVVVAASRDWYDELIQLHHSRGEMFDAAQCRRINFAYRDLIEAGDVCLSDGDKYAMPKIDVTLVTGDSDGHRYPTEDSGFVARVAKQYAELQALLG